MAFLPALAAGLSAVSSGFGWLSSGNYVRLAKQVGKDIKIAGTQIRATIKQAESSVHEVLDDFNRTIEKTETSTKAVLDNARQNAESLIKTGGGVAQQLSNTVRDDLDEVLKVAALEAQFTLGKAGLEIKGVIEKTEKAAQNTGLILSKEVNTQIKSASKELEDRLRQSREEVTEILETTSRELKGAVQLTGEEFERRLGATIIKTNGAVKDRLTQIKTITEELSSKVSQDVEGLIIDLGKQGQMLIQKLGEEFRVSASAALQELKDSCQLVIGEAGEELRLTIGAAGHEVRATMAEVPHIAAETAEAIGESIVIGLTKGLWGLTKARESMNAVSRQLKDPKTNPLELLEWISLQNQFSAYEKYQIYDIFRDKINNSRMLLAPKNLLLVYIGVTALHDKHLTTTSYCGLRRTHYAEHLIESMPGSREADALSPYILLKTHREKALEVLCPAKSVPVIEVIEENPLQKQLEEEQLNLLSTKLELGKKELALIKKERKLAAAEAERDARPVQSDLDTLRKRIGKLESDNQRLEEDRNGLQIKLDRLADQMAGKK